MTMIRIDQTLVDHLLLLTSQLQAALAPSAIEESEHTDGPAKPSEDLDPAMDDEDALAWELEMLTCAVADTPQKDDQVIASPTEPATPSACPLSAREQAILNEIDAIVFGEPSSDTPPATDVRDVDQDEALSAHDDIDVTAAQEAATAAGPGVQPDLDEDDDFRDLDLALGHVTEAEPEAPQPWPKRKLVPGWEYDDVELTDLDFSSHAGAPLELAGVVSPEADESALGSSDLETCTMAAKDNVQETEASITDAETSVTEIEHDRSEDEKQVAHVGQMTFDGPGVENGDDRLDDILNELEDLDLRTPDEIEAENAAIRLACDPVLKTCEESEDDPLAWIDELPVDITGTTQPVEVQLSPEEIESERLERQQTERQSAECAVISPDQARRKCAGDPRCEQAPNPVQQGLGATTTGILSSSSSSTPASSLSCTTVDKSDDTESSDASSLFTPSQKTTKRPPSPYSMIMPDPAWSPVGAPIWRKLNELEKLVQHIRTAEAHGGLAITCQLSEEFHATVLASSNATATLTANLRREFVAEDVEDLP